MRKIWTIAANNLKKFFKSPGAIVLMFVMPALFSWIFGGISVKSEQNKPVVNVVEGKSDINSEVVNLLKKDNQFKWKIVSLKQAKKNVSEEDAVAAVVIPDDLRERIMEKKPLFDMILQRKTNDYLVLSPHLKGTARLVIRSYQAVEAQEAASFPHLLESVANHKGVTMEKETLQKDTNNMADVNLMIVGFTIMFMMFGLSGAASTILEEKTGGTWGRLMITPASKVQISLGYLLGYFFMGWIQFVVLMLTMNLLFDTTWGRFTYLIPFTSLVIMTVVGFGLMIAGLVKTKQQATAISAVLIASTCMLGGVYWPVDIMPDFMQKISLAVPQSWAMSGFKEIISGSLHSETLIKDSAALLGFTILFYFIGLRGIKFE